MPGENRRAIDMGISGGSFGRDLELSEEILVEATSAFFEGMREPDGPVWDSVLDPDILCESPVGSHPTIGIQALRDQFGVLALRWQQVSVSENDLHLCGRRVAATFDITVRDILDDTHGTSGIAIIGLTGEGLISSVELWWDVGQLLPHPSRD
ncbi:MAG: nuclear transport factor 2 family protein [Actinomycetia bacterium]|nr:nuclear transport factor 2 family protein [Actinomycetes bacterium]